MSIQAHISRLMACFRAAYFMWDPLPAIFEEAIREAYIRKFKTLERNWEPERSLAPAGPRTTRTWPTFVGDGNR